MGEHMTREARLKAVERLLDYAIAECQELELPQIEELLVVAALAVSDSFEIETLPAESSPTGRAKMRLVVGQDARFKKENAGQG